MSIQRRAVFDRGPRPCERTPNCSDVGHVAISDNRRVPIPDAHAAYFERIAARARTLFGAAVSEQLLASETHRLPHLCVGNLSVTGEQSLLVEIAPGGYPFVYYERWELDWNTEVDRAIALLEQFHARLTLGPSAADALAARIVALVGEHGAVSVATVQPEFDRVVSVTPRRRGAIPFSVLIIAGWNVVVEGEHLGWWTFGGEFGDDGVAEAWAVIEQLVTVGGAVRTTWRTSELLDPVGRTVSGPHAGGRRLRARRVHFVPYR